ncbi:hypothetical protein [Campylobacter hyointestinalis]|uniref:hypothetical protein n=1 Tax=Campylobacter hyointestinalis TaxID=198 RepID=UPI0011AD2835|nr:hypothetical protein [Campylobacter hyointestinalis]TWO20744.1 hypothetical protein YZ80_05975 [Campylobacter hyointestinalis]
MTTREMIEVMEAFERGEVIEAEIRGTGMYEECVTPDWNWDYMIYRIKPKEEENIKAKFRKGDEIVHKELCNGTPLNKDNNFLIIEDVNLSENKYQVYNKGLGAFEFFDIKKIDEEYVNIDDCLWYWEYYDAIRGIFDIYSARLDTASYKNLYYDYDNERWDLSYEPIYQLGARLPKEHE